MLVRSNQCGPYTDGECLLPSSCIKLMRSTQGELASPRWRGRLMAMELGASGFHDSEIGLLIDMSALSVLGSM